MRVRQTEDGPQLTLPQHSAAEERRILRNALSRLRDFDNRRATNNVTPEVGFSRQEVEQIGIWRLVDMAFQTSMRPSEQLLLRVDWEGQRPRTGPRQRFNAEEAGVSREGSLYSKRLTLTEGNYRDVIRRLASVDVEMEWGSDAQQVLRMLEQTNYTSLVFEKKKVRDRSGNLQQAFWRFTSKLEGIDLSRYQVFHSVQASNYSSNCFIHCLELALADEEGNIPDHHQATISRARMFIRNRVIAQASLKKVANIGGFTFNITKPGAKQTQGTKYEPEVSSQDINIAVIDKHAFLNDKDIGITMYALKHYHDLMVEHAGNVDEFRFVVSADEHKDESRAANSYNVLKYMYDYEILHPHIVSRLNESLSTFDDLRLDLTFQKTLRDELPHFISKTNLEAIIAGVTRNRFAHYMDRITSTVSRPDDCIEIDVN